MTGWNKPVVSSSFAAAHKRSVIVDDPSMLTGLIQISLALPFSKTIFGASVIRIGFGLPHSSTIQLTVSAGTQSLYLFSVRAATIMA